MSNNTNNITPVMLPINGGAVTVAGGNGGSTYSPYGNTTTQTGLRGSWEEYIRTYSETEQCARFFDFETQLITIRSEQKTIWRNKDSHMAIIKYNMKPLSYIAPKYYVFDSTTDKHYSFDTLEEALLYYRMHT